MALKPRTFRRLVLIGSMVSVVLLLAVGYFVVRPMRSQQMLESMRIEGMEAAEAGDHVQAAKKIVRYLKNTPDADPEIILTYARSRLKVQTNDGGYIQASINYYREYLKLVPDDIGVSKELLPLFNVVGMNLEAKNLAENLRTKYNDQSLEVLREERRARRALKSDDPLIEELFDLALADPDAPFADLFEYTEWLRNQDRAEDVNSMIALRMESGDRDVENELLAFWMRINEPEKVNDSSLSTATVEELATILGLDPEFNEWKTEPDFLTPVLVSLVDRIFNVLGRSDLSLTVRITSAELIKDAASMEWSARRLFWDRRYDELLAFNAQGKESEPNPDVLGYQILALRQMDNIEEAASLQEEVNTIVLDFRGKAWRSMFKGQDLLDGDDAIGARQKIKDAIRGYTVEPQFHIVMGDVHSKQGRVREAEQEWLEAQRLVLETVGNVGWIEPNVRIIKSYSSSGRLSEAMKYVDELVLIAPRNMTSTIIWLQSYATLARSGSLNNERVERILNSYEGVQEAFTPSQQLVIAPQIATLYGAAGRVDKARAVLAKAMASSPEPELVLSLLDVDKRFELGVGDSLGIDPSSIGSLTPQRAFQFALLEVGESQDIDAGLEIIDRASIQADSDQDYEWQLVRTRYLDINKDPRAKSAWASLRKEYPENIDLLYQIAESDAAGDDLAMVREVIQQIVKLTATAGKPLPSRLRLAEAAAIIRERETRSSRDEALEIVRAVVSSEPKNISARNMLGRLLTIKPAFGLEPNEIFEPDFQGAIEQYVTIARQLEGRAAQKYLFEAVDLSIELGDPDGAEQYLLEFESSFQTDYEILPFVAQRFEMLNDLQNARDVYSRIYENTQDTSLRISAGLSLANLSLGNNAQRVNELLDTLENVSELSIDQLVQLASINTKAGRKSIGERLARQGEDFGLTQIESKMAYARYASAFISKDEYIKSLEEIVALDPMNEDSWKRLVGNFVREQQFDKAQELVSTALTHLPESKELNALAILAQGEVESASSLIESGVVESNSLNDEAVRRVDAFVAAEQTAPKEDLIGMLTSMLDEFPSFPPIQRYGLPKLVGLRADPQLVAVYADRAGRYMPHDSVVMRIAANSYLQSQSPSDAIRVANIWRANIPGSPIEPDLVAVEAMIQFENYQDASQTIEPYVANAFKNPSDRFNVEIIHAYAHIQIMLGEDPQSVVDQITPLLASNPAIRTRVWLALVTDSASTHEMAAEWISILAPYASADESSRIANAWLIVIEKFKAYIPEYATAAIDLLEPVVKEDIENNEAAKALAVAYYSRAKSNEGPDQQAADFEHAIELLDMADGRDPSNLIYLAQGAAIATDAGYLDIAKSRYRKLLSRKLEPSPFAASMKNNLAMLIERSSTDLAELNEALTLSTEAIQILNAPTFWGTKGWVELALAQTENAETSFQKTVELDPDNVEGWVGLAIVQHQLGAEHAEDFERSFNRVKDLSEAGLISDEYMDRLRIQGDEQWASVLVP
jgi:hypothetical protein